MSDSCPLFIQFCEALNAELLALGCGLHVAPHDPDHQGSMLLVNANGMEVGWLPDHVDARSIAAFEHILMKEHPIH